MTIRHAVILGHSGFIGRRIAHHLQAAEVPVVGLSREQLDLSVHSEARALAPLLTPETVVFVCAATKRQFGDSRALYMSNLAILDSFLQVVERHSARRIVFFSSCAVYGEDIHNLSITEATPLTPRTFYGLSKCAGEWMMDELGRRFPHISIGHLRPPTVYGAGDTSYSYGPSQFLHRMWDNTPITLWGDGRELREFVHVDDLSRLACRFGDCDHQGPLNVVSGHSHTFAQALDLAREISGRTPVINQRDRTKDKVDNAFDPAALQALFPDFRFQTLEDGMRATWRQEYLKHGTAQ